MRERREKGSEGERGRGYGNGVEGSVSAALQNKVMVQYICIAYVCVCVHVCLSVGSIQIYSSQSNWLLEDKAVSEWIPRH